MLNEIRENALIERLAGSFSRSPLQLNALQESDAELIRLPGTELVLALKTDLIVEEIETGLYDDPYLIGWMAVMANASDLAAVGAQPVGVLLAETIPPEAEAGFLAKLQAGVRDACAVCGLHVLGGDTNYSAHMQVGAFALGLIPNGAPMTRIGCQAGDLLYSSGALGQGSVYAFCKLQGEGRDAAAFRPVARIREGQAVRLFASCCMDTSDGALATLDQLMRLNGVGFRLSTPLEKILHPDALALARSRSLAPWMLLAGPHGEFELLFTVRSDREPQFLECADALGWHPLCLGAAMTEPAIHVVAGTGTTVLDTATIRNLFGQCGGRVDAFIQGLHRLGPAPLSA
jgi:thiamine-monophosphate kinase